MIGTPMNSSDHDAVVHQRWVTRCETCYWRSPPYHTAQKAQWEAQFHNTSDEHLANVRRNERLKARRDKEQT